MTTRAFDETQNCNFNIPQEDILKILSPPKRESSYRWKKRSRNDQFSLLETIVDHVNSLNDDLFLYVMRFIVPESGDVDGESLRNMSQVCKQWYGLVNAPSLWTSPTVDPTAPDIAGPLIGYRKVEKLRCLWKQNPTYRVVDRATNQVYLVRIMDHTSPEALRHIGYTNDLLSGALLHEAPPEMKAAFLFPVRMKIPAKSSKVVLWYDDCEQTLQDWFDTSDRCRNPVFCSEPPQVLPVPLEQLKNWMRQLLTSFILLQNHGVPYFDAWAKPENIFMDKNSSRLRIALPEIATTAHIVDNYMHVPPWKANPDLYELGCIFSTMARSGSRAPAVPSEESAYNKWLNDEFPALDDLGRTFLRIVFDHELRKHVDPASRSCTPEEALAHPFLHPQSNGRPIQTGSDSIWKRKLSLELTVQPKRRVVSPFEWAALVDWVVEVCTVFEVGELAAFRAIAYFDRVMSGTPNHFRRSHYQVLVAACLLIASKITGNISIAPSDLANCADNSFEADGLVVYEQYILERLEWKLMSPTSLEFAMAISESTTNTPREAAIHYSVVVFALQTELYRSYPASIIGAAASVVAKYCVQRPLWDACTEKETGIALLDLQSPVSSLCTEVNEILSNMSDLKAIARSFAVEDFGARSIPRVLDLQHYRP
ncbi:hypothetical protein MHU86_25848 [Fragilaria crotonensis]|nr:hypothetical protein MHU86_25848 [Fragilaria crotonensis]